MPDFWTYSAMKGSMIQVANMIFGNNIASRMVKIWLISNCSATSYLHYLVQLFPIFHNHDVGFAVISNVVAGLWRIGCVYSCDNPSRSKNCVYIYLCIYWYIYIYMHTQMYLICRKQISYQIKAEKGIKMWKYTLSQLPCLFQVFRYTWTIYAK